MKIERLRTTGSERCQHCSQRRWDCKQQVPSIVNTVYNGSETVNHRFRASSTLFTTAVRPWTTGSERRQHCLQRRWECEQQVPSIVNTVWNSVDDARNLLLTVSLPLQIVYNGSETANNRFRASSTLSSLQRRWDCEQQVLSVVNTVYNGGETVNNRFRVSSTLFTTAVILWTTGSERRQHCLQWQQDCEQQVRSVVNTVYNGGETVNNRFRVSSTLFTMAARLWTCSEHRQHCLQRRWDREQQVPSVVNTVYNGGETVNNRFWVSSTLFTTAVRQQSVRLTTAVAWCQSRTGLILGTHFVFETWISSQGYVWGNLKVATESVMTTS